MKIEVIESVIEELERRNANIKSITSIPIVDEVTKPSDKYKKFKQIGEKIVFEIIDERNNTDEH